MHTQDTITEIIRLRKAGMKQNDIAATVRVHYSTVNEILQRNGLGKNQNIKKARNNRIIYLHKNGWTQKRIAQKFKMSQASVHRILRIAGLAESYTRRAYREDGHVVAERLLNRLYAKAPDARAHLHPCSLVRKNWPICFENRCYLRTRCQAFERAAARCPELRMNDSLGENNHGKIQS